MSTIVDVHARQILDSRGNPTIEVEVSPDFNGLVVFDVWIPDFDATINILSVDIGIRNPHHDWLDNTPIHILPLDLGDPLFGATFDHLGGIVYTFVGFHDFGEHPVTLF